MRIVIFTLKETGNTFVCDVDTSSAFPLIRMGADGFTTPKLGVTNHSAELGKLRSMFPELKPGMVVRLEDKIRERTNVVYIQAVFSTPNPLAPQLTLEDLFGKEELE